MKKNPEMGQGGFIKMIIVILITLALLKIVFDFDIFTFLKIPAVQNAVSYIWNIIMAVWNAGLEKIVLFAWENGKQLLSIGWTNLITLLGKISEIIDLINTSK